MASVYLTRRILFELNQQQYLRLRSNDYDTNGNNSSEVSDGKYSLTDLATNMICRVCMKSACTPLAEKIGDCDIISGIRMIANIPISIDDCLPKFICTECLESLRLALAFRRNCELSDKQFRKSINPLSDLRFRSYPYSKHDFQLILHQMKLKRVQESEQRKAVIKTLKNRLMKKKKPRTKQFKCNPCDIVFLKKEKLQAHQKLRQCTKHPCVVCGQLVLNVNQHMRQAHKDKSSVHKCEICGNEYPIAARLRSHMMVHTNTFRFFCDLCPYKSKHKYYLVMHMRTHTGEKPYRCALCPATFVNASNFNKHKLTHQDRQFQCALCDKSFRSTGVLRSHHEATHMNMKHTCRLCGRDFCYKSDLRKHEIRYHNRVKRNYIGGEPTYKQVERLEQLQRTHEADKWRQQSLPLATPVHPSYVEHSKAFGPTHTLYTFSDSTLMHQQPIVVQQPVSLPLMSNLSPIKNESEIFQAQPRIGYY